MSYGQALNKLHSYFVTKKNPQFDELTYVADPNYSVLFMCENDILEVRNDT